MTYSNALVVTEAVLDFGDRPEADYRYTLQEAAVLIHKHEAERDRLNQREIVLVLEQGGALHTAHELCQAHGIGWHAWIKDFLPAKFSVDTARNYINLWLRFKHILQQPESVQERANLGALYKLATERISDEVRAAYLDALVAFPELKGDTDLAMIAKHSELHNRFLRHDLTVKQAAALAAIWGDLTANIQVLVHEHSIRDASVARFLQACFYDYVNTEDSKRPAKTWADLESNQFKLLWTDKSGIDHCVDLEDANADTCKIYLDYRADMHKGGRYNWQRAKAQVLRQADGTFLLQVAADVFPEGFSGDELFIDLRFKGD